MITEYIILLVSLLYAWYVEFSMILGPMVYAFMLFERNCFFKIFGQAAYILPGIT